MKKVCVYLGVCVCLLGFFNSCTSTTKESESTVKMESDSSLKMVFDTTFVTDVETGEEAMMIDTIYVK